MERKHGNLENTILTAIWEIEESDQFFIDVMTVQSKINNNSKKWAYTTVKTVLDRLVEKKYIRRIKQGKKYFYQSVVSKTSEADEAIRKIAKLYFNDDIEEMIKAANRICEESIMLV